VVSLKDVYRQEKVVRNLKKDEIIGFRVKMENPRPKPGVSQRESYVC